MISINPFSEIGTFIPSFVMQTYVVAMFLLVIGATIFDVIHKTGLYRKGVMKPMQVAEYGGD